MQQHGRGNVPTARLRRRVATKASSSYRVFSNAFMEGRQHYDESAPPFPHAPAAEAAAGQARARRGAARATPSLCTRMRYVHPPSTAHTRPTSAQMPGTGGRTARSGERCRSQRGAPHRG